MWWNLFCCKCNLCLWCISLYFSVGLVQQFSSGCSDPPEEGFDPQEGLAAHERPASRCVQSRGCHPLSSCCRLRLEAWTKVSICLQTPTCVGDVMWSVLKLSFFKNKKNEGFYIAQYLRRSRLKALGYTSKCIEAVPAKDSNPGCRRANPPL
jgi:hypothetical protein